jgi:protein CpxP
MKLLSKSTLVAACIVGGLGFVGTAMAYGPEMGGQSHGMMGEHGSRDSAKMQQRMTKHLGELKAKLKLTADQEGAWTALTAAMQTPAGKGPKNRDEAKKLHDEMQKLTTPERIDRMKAMHAERQSQMDKMGGAIKNFYTVLNAEQRKVFDANAMLHQGPKGHRN